VIKQVFSDEGLTADQQVLDSFAASILAWLANPFSPHAIARWRSGTYRWVVVQKYLDNLIEWADSLFRQDTIESINEATQIYLLASAILGPRPRRLPAVNPVVRTFDELDVPALFGGLHEVEGFLPPPPQDPGPGDWEANPGAPAPVWWYFCVPPNDKLLAYWDTVADRLFKIRNCQNIEGVTRQLALFEPPIDPALLVKAKAAGLDLAAVIADAQSPIGPYRYRVLAARASEFCADVRALGAALLQAIEKNDAELLAQLRASHEVSLLKAIRDARQEQIREAEAQIEALKSQSRVVASRNVYYGTKQRVSGKERSHLDKLFRANVLMIASQASKLAASVLAAVPTIYTGTMFASRGGGEQWKQVPDIVGDALGLASSVFRNRAERQLIYAGYERRWEDWQFQTEQAWLEGMQINDQITAAEIRRDVARLELRNHDRQIEQAEAFELALRSKWSNDELFQWMSGQLSSVYFQSYKLAYDMAKQAERAMQYELLFDDSFVEYGHWDSLRKGLLAGERLQLDLRRMEASYLQKNVREFEVTKRVSLRLTDPTALLDLRELGRCTFAIPEVLFDLDHPGHYARRIKAVAVTIPAVVGPHTSLSAKLTLLEHRTRISTDTSGGYASEDPVNDGRFRLGYGPTTAIATSHGRGDTGLFQLDFRDDRWLPFEGAGAISRWRLQLPDSVRQFDYETISDVEIQIQYTARDGGDTLRDLVEDDLASTFNDALTAPNGPWQGPGMLMLSAKSSFAAAWERFLYPAEGEESEPLEIPITVDQFPYLVRARQPRVIGVRLIFLVEPGASGVFGGLSDSGATLTPPGAGAISFTGAGILADGEGATATTGAITAVAVGAGAWLFAPGTMTIESPDEVRDLIVLVDFDIASTGP
jgi:hypothetical protein